MTAETNMDEVLIDGDVAPDTGVSGWRPPFVLEDTPEPERRRLPWRRRVLKRQLRELAVLLAQREKQLGWAEAKLHRQQEHLLAQTRSLQQQAQQLKEETTRCQAAELVLRTNDEPPAGGDPADVDARRLAIHARARAAIAEMAGSPALTQL